MNPDEVEVLFFYLTSLFILYSESINHPPLFMEHNMFFKNLTKGLKVEDVNGRKIELKASDILSHRKGEVKTLLISGGKSVALKLEVSDLNRLCIHRKICGHAA